MTDERRKSVLSPATLVPLGVVVACCASVIIAVVKFHSWISGQFDTLSAEIKDLKTSTQTISGNRWTSQDMEIYALRMEKNNPTLKVPDVSEIIKRREQNQSRP